MSEPSQPGPSPEPSTPAAAAGPQPEQATRAAPAAPAASTAGARLALFRAGGRLCGVAAAFCKQFVQLDAVTPVPLGPAPLLGVTQLRGRILPVLDAASLLGLEPPAAGSPPADGADGGSSAAAGGMPALVVTATGLDSAMAALRVSEIVGFELPAPSVAGPGSRVLWRGEEVTVLDLAAVLAPVRLQGRAGCPPWTSGRLQGRAASPPWTSGRPATGASPHPGHPNPQEEEARP
jgi:chemotaxis signal transduction protein